MDIVQTYAVFFIMFSTVGLPVYVALHHRPVLSPTALFSDLPLYGLLVTCTLLPWLLLTRQFTPQVLFISLAAFTVILALVQWRKFRTIQIDLKLNQYFLLCGLVVTIALILRNGNSYFIFMTGDMGQYVNNANRVAVRGWHLNGFPHLFTANLALSNFIFGVDGTVRIVQFFGLLSIPVVDAIGKTLDFDRVIRFALLVVTSFCVYTVWFAKFPASEGLYSLLFLSFILFSLRAIYEDSLPAAITAGLFVGLMGITRGNALFFIALLGPFLILSCGLLKDCITSRRTVVALAMSAILSFSLAFAYNSQQLVNYYVNVQIKKNVGPTVYKMLKSIGFFDAGIAYWSIIALCLALTYLAIRLLWRKEFWETYAKIFAYLLVFLFLGLMFFHETKGFTRSLGYMTAPVLFFAVVGLVTVPTKKMPPHYFFLMLLTGFAWLYCKRIEAKTTHAYYLYWHRYLFSEVFWIVLIFFGHGLQWMNLKLSRLPSIRPFVYGLTVVTLAVYLLKISAPLANQAIFEGSFKDIKWLSSSLDKVNGPVFFSGFREENNTRPSGWFFPNAWRCYMHPLRMTFNHKFVQMRTYKFEPFGKDPVTTPKEISRFLRKNNKELAYLITANRPDAGPATENLWMEPSGQKSGVTWRLMKSKVTAVPLLGLSRRKSQEKFHNSYVRLAVYEFSLDRVSSVK